MSLVTGLESASTQLTTEELLRKDSEYCSYGDTVHYADPPKIFSRCDGSYLFDDRGTPYLDLQMWYSAVNFGYANRRLNDWHTRTWRVWSASIASSMSVPTGSAGSALTTCAICSCS